MRKANWFFVCPMRFALPLAYAALNWAITCAVVRSEFGVERDHRAFDRTAPVNHQLWHCVRTGAAYVPVDPRRPRRAKRMYSATRRSEA